ncbi:tail chaperonin [Achromobacter phage 83-24]|uniref:Uncharacterized protein n=1 Tax=Achromobacter phage 83-24 TaxID=1589747 RepID=A0A0B5A590_9CAUD|nr:tail chaperonin [Achromobacter phage 83-24]AJD82850.1 hypothetical protein JWAP_00017 [Achromobacter phage 83-24]
MQQGRPLPARIANAPELKPGLELYWLAFQRLSSGRPVGMAPGAISWMQIEEYCDRVHVYGEERDIMHHHIQKMDAEYLKAIKAKAAKNRGKSNDPPQHKR